MSGVYPDGCTQADIDRAANGDESQYCPNCKEHPCECCRECGANPDQACERWCGLRLEDEGNPTSEINYLQRLRILLEKEAENASLKAQLAEILNRPAYVEIASLQAQLAAKERELENYAPPKGAI